MEILEGVGFREGVKRLLSSGAGWTELQALLHPHVSRIVGASTSLGPLRHHEDHVRNATTEVFSKLARNEFRALALLEPWLEAHPTQTAADWLRIVVANVVREYVSRVIGHDATKRFLHTLTEAMPDTDVDGLRPPVTTEQSARQILEYAAVHLSREQLVAREAWLQDVDFAEIGRGVSDEDPRRAGEKLVRSALARLRRQFA